MVPLPLFTNVLEVEFLELRSNGVLGNTPPPKYSWGSVPKRAEARRYQPCQLPAAARLPVGPFLSLDPLRVQLDRGRNPLRSGRRGDRLAADLLRTRLAVCHLERRPSVDRRPATAHERQDSVVGQEALRGQDAADVPALAVEEL